MLCFASHIGSYVCVCVIVYMCVRVCVCLCHANEAINKNFKFNLDSLLDDGSSFALAARLHLLPFSRLLPLPPFARRPCSTYAYLFFISTAVFCFATHTHTHIHTLADTHTRGYNLISHALLALNFALASCSHFKLCRL